LTPKYYRLYKLLLIIVLLSYPGFAEAQQPNYLFHKLGIKNGLNQENVSAVCQDKRGFLWLAGNTGIQRYDGHRFLNFFAGTKGVLPAGMITSMSMDQKGRLWIITNHAAVGYFDTDRFIYHSVKVNLPATFANTAAAINFGDGSNIMLIYVGRGLITYNEKANEFSQQYNRFNLPAGFEPRHLVYGADGNYWIATNNGFVKYSSKKKLLSYGGHNAENDPFINAFGFIKNCRVIYTDSLKRIWFSYLDAVGYIIKSFNPASGEIKNWEKILNKSLKGTSHDFWGISHFSDGSLWMSGPGLLAKVDYDQYRIEPVLYNQPGEYSIRFDVAGSLFEDREKSIWACTDMGLYRFNPSAHNFNARTNRLPGEDKAYANDVTAVLETKNGDILISTWGQGIFSYDKNFSPVVSKYLNRKNEGKDMVWCMVQTQNGDIWRGGQNGTLSVYDATTGKIVTINNKIFNGKTIRQLVEDKEGNIWLGTQGGHLIKWSPADKQFRLQQQFKNLISRLYVDNSNTLWACTDLDGVYHLKSTDGTIIAHYTSKGAENKKMLINGASDIIQYNDSTMVIAANGLNILNTKTGNFSYWDEGAQIANMIKDKKGNLWLATNIGIVCRQLDKEWSHISFNARDGVNNFIFNTAAAGLLKNGHIVFGTNHDFLTFDPVKAMTFDFQLPEVQIAEIAVMNKRLPVDSVRQLSQLNLSHTQNSFTIKFSTNNFQNLTPVEYMIEGIDKDWKNTTGNGEVSLNYLAPGKYVLKVTTKDGTGAIGKIISITIVIAAPFYKQWWFFSIIALLVIGLLIWLDRERMNRKQAMQNIRSNIAGKLHEDVNIALNNINVLSEIALMKADTEPQKSKEFVEQIHSKSQNMMIAMDDMLWSISPENDSMEKAVQRMQEYIDELNNRHTASIKMLVEEKVKRLNIDMQLRQEALLLFKEGITGLIKTGVRECKIHLRLEKAELVYIIECKNEGSDLQQLNYLLNGQDMTKRLKAINAKMDIEVHKTVSVLRCRIHL
jgi:ligand-binding sensor domain-containing protein